MLLRAALDLALGRTGDNGGGDSDCADSGCIDIERADGVGGDDDLRCEYDAAGGDDDVVDDAATVVGMSVVSIVAL